MKKIFKILLLSLTLYGSTTNINAEKPTKKEIHDYITTMQLNKNLYNDFKISLENLVQIVHAKILEEEEEEEGSIMIAKAIQSLNTTLVKIKGKIKTIKNTQKTDWPIQELNLSNLNLTDKDIESITPYLIQQTKEITIYSLDLSNNKLNKLPIELITNLSPAVLKIINTNIKHLPLEQLEAFFEIMIQNLNVKLPMKNLEIRYKTRPN